MFAVNDQIRQDNMHGEECIYRGSAMPLPQGVGPKHSPVLGYPSVYAYTL